VTVAVAAAPHLEHLHDRAVAGARHMPVQQGAAGAGRGGLLVDRPELGSGFEPGTGWDVVGAAHQRHRSPPLRMRLQEGVARAAAAAVHGGGKEEIARRRGVFVVGSLGQAAPTGRGWMGEAPRAHSGRFGWRRRCRGLRLGRCRWRPSIGVVVRPGWGCGTRWASRRLRWRVLGVRCRMCCADGRSSAGPGRACTGLREAERPRFGGGSVVYRRTGDAALAGAGDIAVAAVAAVAVEPGVG
jgi:hypothetical protein